MSPLRTYSTRRRANECGMPPAESWSRVNEWNVNSPGHRRRFSDGTDPVNSLSICIFIFISSIGLFTRCPQCLSKKVTRVPWYGRGCTGARSVPSSESRSLKMCEAHCRNSDKVVDSCDHERITVDNKVRQTRSCVTPPTYRHGHRVEKKMPRIIRDSTI